MARQEPHRFPRKNPTTFAKSQGDTAKIRVPTLMQNPAPKAPDFAWSHPSLLTQSASGLDWKSTHLSPPSMAPSKPKNKVSKGLEKLLSEQTAVILNAVDARFAAQDKKLEARFDAIDHRFGVVDKRLTALEARFTEKLDRLTNTLDKFLKRMTDMEQEFTFMKHDVTRIKAVLREKLGVALD
jgi:hypothetical protein